MKKKVAAKYLANTGGQSTHSLKSPLAEVVINQLPLNHASDYISNQKKPVDGENLRDSNVETLHKGQKQKEADIKLCPLCLDYEAMDLRDHMKGECPEFKKCEKLGLIV